MSRSRRAAAPQRASEADEPHGRETVISPAQFAQLIGKLRNFEILGATVPPDLSHLGSSNVYQLTPQDKRLQNALKYMITNFFTENSEKDLHAYLEASNYKSSSSQYRAGESKEEEDADADGTVAAAFDAHLQEFYDLFSRFMRTLVAYTHDCENRPHFHTERNDPAYQVMGKWKLIIADMEDIYQVVQFTARGKTRNSKPITHLWAEIIKNNIFAVRELSDRMLRYQAEINDARRKLHDRDVQINEIDQKYARINLTFAELQGRYEQARQGLTALNTGADSLAEFEANAEGAPLPSHYAHMAAAGVPIPQNFLHSPYRNAALPTMFAGPAATLPNPRAASRR